MQLINYRCELYPPILKGYFSPDKWIAQTKFYFQFQHLQHDNWVFQVASTTNADDYGGASLEVTCVVHYIYKGKKPTLHEAVDLSHNAVRLMNDNINREILPRVKIHEPDIITPFKDEDITEELEAALAEAYSN
ncbi:MAG TPA: hypothetical protein VD794_14625 [Flavisolibacter sp.]|nr:hypothetical protein [Flavisolibacter sp.]